MKSIKPYSNFFILSIVTFVLGWYNYAVLTNSALDINIHDTYFVIAFYNVYILFGGIFALIGIIYWIYSKTSIKLNRLLVNIHTTICIGCFVIYILGLLYFRFINYDEFPLFDNSSKEIIFIAIILSIFILVQIIFILNIVISTTKHFISKRKS